ncbi:MAG: hypothetical protein QG632_318 [Candidatus Dependentiae bacterium]|nr:hypothetical protein [Candidatus Dependentiae bacterium]
MICVSSSAAYGSARHAPTLSGSSPITIAGVVCGKEGARLYLPQSVYSDYIAAGGKLLISLKREKSMVQQFTSLSTVTEVAKAVGSAISYALVQICLGDKTVCLLPTTFLTALGLPEGKPVQRLGVDRRSMREFMHMMEKLRTSFTGREAEDERLLARYLYNSPITDQCNSRSIKRVLWGFDPLPAWVERVVLRQEDCGSSDASSVSTRSSSSTSNSSYSSTSSGLSSDLDSTFSIGYLSSTKSVAGLALEYGKEEFMSSFFKGDKMLDLSGQGLNTLDDFCQVFTNFFSAEELLKVTELNLANNALAELPIGAFSCFPALQSLMLNNNPLRSISVRALQGLEKLEKLFMADVAALELPEEFLKPVPRLTLLFLPRCGLASCPSLRLVLKLKTLDISGNQFTDLPNISFLPDLRVLNAMDNKIVMFDIARLPRDKDGQLMLSTLQLNDNLIAVLPTTFYSAMPQKGFLLTLHNNPLWESVNTQGVLDGLKEIGFDAIDDESRKKGGLLATEVSDYIFNDIRDTVCCYLGRKDPIIASVVWNEIKQQRPLSCLETTKADRVKWVQDNEWWIMAGVTLITGGIGAIVGLFVRQAGKTFAKRAAVGGAIGAVFGAAASALGCTLASQGGHMYMDTGGSSVHMTSDLKRLYVGTYRIIALLALFKQYLIALSVSLLWLSHYDKFLQLGNRVDLLMRDLEIKMWVATKKLLARVDEPTTLAMLHELTCETPMDEIRKHTPVDLFPGESLENVNLSAGADFRWIGQDKLAMVRAVIIRFSAAARTVRAALVNRYMGTYDHARVCRLMCDAAELREGLSLIMTEVVTPLRTGMETAGETDLVWHEELRRFGLVVNECNIALEIFVKHKACLEKIVR